MLLVACVACFPAKSVYLVALHTEIGLMSQPCRQPLAVSNSLLSIHEKGSIFVVDAAIRTLSTSFFAQVIRLFLRNAHAAVPNCILGQPNAILATTSCIHEKCFR